MDFATEHSGNPVPRTDADAEYALTFARAALALAGHEVTDPQLKALHELAARGEISMDEARETGLRHILG